jgi:hypothetical protein
MSTYTWKLRTLVDDIVYEVKCTMITVKAGADVDIGIVDSKTVHYD